MIPGRRARSLLVALALVGAACSGDGDTAETTTTSASPSTATSTSTATSSTTTTSTSSTTTTTLPSGPTSPFTGLEVADEDLLDRRVISVKIDNHWDARPQSGLELADAVYELRVEAGLTRFIAVFHHSDAEYLGPMRSGRPTDTELIAPFDGTFAMSGASHWVYGVMNADGARLIGEVRPATFRESFRRAPHNLYVNTVLLREHADGLGHPDEAPPPLFARGELPEGATDAEEILFRWSDGQTVTWTWDGTTYLRASGNSPHETRTEDDERAQVSTDVLVVLLGDLYTQSGGAGTVAVPSTVTTGTGQAMVFAEGKVVEGTWERSSIDDPFVLRDGDGEILPVPPGRPWISMFPDNRTISW